MDAPIELPCSYKGDAMSHSPQALADVYHHILLVASAVRDVFLRKGGVPRCKYTIGDCISALDRRCGHHIHYSSVGCLPPYFTPVEPENKGGYQRARTSPKNAGGRDYLRRPQAQPRRPCRAPTAGIIVIPPTLGLSSQIRQLSQSGFS